MIRLGVCAAERLHRQAPKGEREALLNLGPHLQRFFSAPVFANRHATRVAAAIHMISLYLIAAAGFWSVAYTVITPEAEAGLLLALAAILGAGSSIALVRRGRIEIASWVLIGMIWVVTTLAIVYSGLDSPAISAYLIAVVTAGLLLDARRAVGVALASAVTSGGIGLLAWMGSLPEPMIVNSLFTYWGVEVTLLAAMAGVIAIYLKNIRDAEQEVARSRELLVESQKMEALGRLAGAISHDFNNILTVIRANAEVASELDEDPGTARQLNLEVIDAADRASALTRQLLAFSRKDVTQPRVLEINSLLADLERMLARLIGEQVELDVTLDPELAYIQADPAQVEQVILNLAINARDAMPEGGRLEIRVDRTEVDEREACQNDLSPGSYVCLTVTDSGIGMEPEIREQIFEPFFSTKDLARGTGLGLATVYGIVTRNGGTIRVESVLGRGSRFEVLLPRVEAGNESENEGEQENELELLLDPTTDEEPRGNETILVAEDERRILELIRAKLETAGYEVLDAPDGVAALELTQRHDGPIDLLISDIVMPRMGGPELFDELLNIHPKLGVIFISGYPHLPAGKSVVPEGAVYLQKPFRLSELAIYVRRVLDARKPRLEKSSGADSPSREVGSQ